MTFSSSLESFRRSNFATDSKPISMETNKSIFIATTQPFSGKSIVALGLVDMLLAKAHKIGYFKPIINNPPEVKKDSPFETLIQHFKLPIQYEKSYGYTKDQANQLIESGLQGEIIDTIISKYKVLEEENDFNEAINALSKTFKQTPFISLTLFQKLGKRLNYCPYKLMALHNMLKNNGDYFAIFYDEEDGI